MFVDITDLCTVVLPSVSGSDGSGDTFKHKYYVIYNSTINNVTVSSTEGLIGTSATYTLNPSESISVISNGTKWISFSSNTSIDNLSAIGDVHLTSLTDGQALVYSSATGTWINSTITSNGGTLQTASLPSCNSLYDMETTLGQIPRYSYVSPSYATNNIDRLKFLVYSKDAGTIPFVGCIYRDVAGSIQRLTSGTTSVTTTGFNTITLTSAISLNAGDTYYFSLLKRSTSAVSLVADTCLPLSNISFGGASVSASFEPPAIESTRTNSDTTIWMLAYSSTSLTATGTTTTTSLSALSIASVSANYVATYNQLIKAYSSDGSIYIMIPDPSSSTGLDIRVKKMSNDLNSVILSANGAWSIEGSTSASIHNSNTSITLTSDGTSWLIT
jgi:hypothetical protein